MKTPTIHATCVVIGQHGVLLRGPSGAGKSRLALHFIETAAERGRFSRLVGDDRIHLSAQKGRLIASAPDQIAGLIERRTTGLRDRGIEKIDYLPSWPVALVVDIVSDADFATQPSTAAKTITIKDVTVAHLVVPARFDLAIAQIEAILPRLQGQAT